MSSERFFFRLYHYCSYVCMLALDFCSYTDVSLSHSFRCLAVYDIQQRLFFYGYCDDFLCHIATFLSCCNCFSLCIYSFSLFRYRRRAVCYVPCVPFASNVIHIYLKFPCGLISILFNLVIRIISLSIVKIKVISFLYCTRLELIFM